MAPLLLVLLTWGTALLLVGAEGPLHGAPPGGVGTPWPGPRWDQRPLDTEDEDEDGLQLSDDDIMSGGGLPTGVVRCAICKRVVTALKDTVVDPNNKEKVARVTQRVCGRLRVGAGLCRRLLHSALAPIEKALAHHQTPARLCAHLRWCHPQP